MSNTAITQLVAACAGLVACVAFVALVVVPAVSSYQRPWERMAAGLLSLWVLAAFVGIGILAGVGVIYYWPRVF
jgi:uncharacterized membrane protein